MHFLMKRFCFTVYIYIIGVGLAAGQATNRLTEDIEYAVSAQASFADGEHTPFWLNANKYGLSSLDKQSGYLRASLVRPLANDSARRWGVGYGADAAVAYNNTSTLILQQAFVEARWLKGVLTVGSKEQPMELKNQELSTGSQTLGINSRPAPMVRLSLPDYWDIPYTAGWLGLKGHIAYGMATDDGWQKDFTHQQSRYTEHARLHTKAGYLRVGRSEKPLTLELGLEMACQFGGTSYGHGDDATIYYKGETGLKSMLNALIPAGTDATDSNYENAAGNHVGSWVARVNYQTDDWRASVYADHFFEDQSSMFLLDYDGYGHGSEWDVKKDSRYFRYNLKDIMIGAELCLKKATWLNAIVVEYLYTKYQCGPVYHDHTPNISTHISGRDDYYNHTIYTGWQHWGMAAGNPLYRSPLYNDNGRIEVQNNRFTAWHVGFSGTPLPHLHYRILATWQKGFGTYDAPYTDPQRNTSLLAEAAYQLHKGWSVKGAFAMDRGGIYGDNTGLQLTIAKVGLLNRE